MGQGQTKAAKRRETNGEQGPSPKKEAKKSPKKRGSKGSRSSRSPSTDSQTKGQGHMLIEQKEATTVSASTSQEVNGDNNGLEEVTMEKLKQMESPPKPKRTYEVDFVEPEKENVPEKLDELNVSEIRKDDSSPKSTLKINGEYEPFTPVKNSDLNHVPQATSTPAPNGILSTGTGRQLSGGSSKFSDDDHTDVSDDEAYASEQQDSSYEKKLEVNYGKFYNQSYLKTGSSNYLSRGRAQSEPKIKNNVNQFIRPANFSYSKEPPSFLKTKKGGMMSLAQGKTVVKTTRRSSSPAAGSGGAVTGVRKSSEPVRMSTFPGGKPPPPKEIAKIDRDDWPAPPSPAAILPEILRQRRKSRGEEDDDEEPVFEDPKIKREIEELKKFKDESGIGKVIYNELEVAKQAPLKPLDPWKSSRVPNAAYEPKYQTRYQSPMFASPSRFLDRTRRSWDDCDIRAGYRTIAILGGHVPAPKPGYGLAPRAATLPVSGLYGGPLDLDYVTSTIFDQPGVSLMTFQKSSWHTESKPPVYDYERLKISNFDLPKDVDRDQLELHLEKEQFEDIFGMSSDSFKHLPEWKRNDLKRKKDLY
ncbi:Actin-binding LIM protein 3 [Mactra antiquata]